MGWVVLLGSGLLGIAIVVFIGWAVRGGEFGQSSVFIVLMSTYFLAVMPWQNRTRARRLRDSAAAVLGE